MSPHSSLKLVYKFLDIMSPPPNLRIIFLEGSPMRLPDITRNSKKDLVEIRATLPSHVSLFTNLIYFIVATQRSLTKDVLKNDKSALLNETMQTEYQEDYAKYYIIKTFTEENVSKAMRHGIWSSTETGNRKLNSAYKKCLQMSRIK
jgi:hypothetical protein